jgi:hypothetical protein
MTFQNPIPRVGIGWVLAIIAFIIGLLTVLDVVVLTPHLLGICIMLLSLAILL